MSDKSGERNATVADNGGIGEGETAGNSGGSGTTMATQKKRLRRVSFAEMTSVHFFDRDEEVNETPKEHHSAGKDGNGDAERDEILGFLQLVGPKGKAEEDGETVESEEEDEEQAALQRPFLRPLESPSSGSGFGSATSNDEDFFGPVSASFIRRGCLSDSEASDDNRDVTMDSTAFSMHYQSLARSDSGVDLKTPTGVRLTFEEKPSSKTNVGNTMELTVSKKQLSITSSPTGKRIGNSNSSDMSLVGESPSKYDYGRLSPELDALLAKGTMNLGLISNSHNRAGFDLPRNLGNASFPARENLSVASEYPNDSGNMPFAPQENLADLVDLSSNNEKAVCFLQEQSGGDNGHANIVDESPSGEFTSSPSKERKIPESSTAPVKYKSVLTPQPHEDSSLGKEEFNKYRSASSIEKSISKLNLLEASPFSASITSRIENLKIRPKVPEASPFKIQLEREMKSFQLKYHDASSIGVENQFLVGSPKKGAQISVPSTDKHNVLDREGRETILLTEDSRAADVSSSPSSRGKGSSGTPAQLVTSIDSQKKMTAYPKHQNSYDLVLPDQFAHLQSSGVKENGVNVNLPAQPLELLDSLPVGTRLQLASPVVNPEENRDVKGFDKQDGLQMMENHGTPLRATVSQLTNSRDMDGSLHACIDLHMPTMNLPCREPQSAPSGASVPFSERNLTEITFPQIVVDPFPQSASKEDSLIIGRKNMDSHYMVDYSAPSSNQLRSLRKRSGILDFEDIEHHSVVAYQQRSLKLRKVGHEMLGSLDEDFKETTMTIQGSKHWADIYSKFSEYGERLVQSSVDKLKLSVIDSFGDILYNLKKAKSYGMLCSEIFPQRTSISNGLHSKRVGEVRLLLHQITHEKAKLQLLWSKQKLLLEKLQPLSSGVQEIEVLKMNLLPKYVPNFVSRKQRDEDASEKVSAMKQALEAVNNKKANFVKALHSYCKIKKEPSHSDCILLANDHLINKACHRFVRLGMQIWDVESVGNSNDLHKIFLNYLGFIIQSFKFVGFPASTVVISNKLDDAKIVKSFPNMDACTAFSSVLSAGITQKYVASQILARETQVTSSLLGNLMDVVGELQLARIELRNFTHANFHCPIVGQLNLHLGFFTFKLGKKVSLNLDLSCLNRGIYPFEMLPSQVNVSGGNSLLVEPLIHNIQHAVKSLRAGYMRVLRLCRCISVAVQGSSE